MADIVSSVGQSPRDNLGQPLTERWVEVRPGEHSLERVAFPPALQELWTDGTLVGGGGSVSSPWLDLTLLDSLRLMRTHAGGTYSLEVDWGRDGATVDVTQALTLANNESAELVVAARFARFRVNNTDGLNAFTAHRTNVFGR